MLTLLEFLSRDEPECAAGGGAQWCKKAREGANPFEEEWAITFQLEVLEIV